MLAVTAFHFNILSDIYVGVLFALLPAYMLALLTNFLDDAMDYGSIFWKLRAYKARQAVIKMNGDISALQECFDAAYDEDDTDTQVQIVAGMYDQIASKYFPFKRWICKVCMGVYFSISIALIGSLGLFILGLPLVTIISFLLCLPLLTYRFI